MPYFTAASKVDFLQQLQAALVQHVDEELAPQVGMFAEQFFRVVALSELVERRKSDLLGATLNAWRLCRHSDQGQPMLQVFNPDYEKHGWQSTHSVVQVLHPDMPFLVDSVRMELTRRGYSIHTLQNTVLQVRRGTGGEFIELLADGAHTEDSRAESLIFVEIDRVASTAALHDLEQSLQGILAEVRLVVGDFPLMKARAEAHCELLDQLPGTLGDRQVDEIKAFMRWLADDHFTFLGYETFTIDEEKGCIRYEPSSLLGLSRHLREGAGEEPLPPQGLNYLREPSLLSFAKAATASRVHRPAYPDYVSIRELDEEGRVIRESRFLGLFTSSVYTQSVRDIPFIRDKVAQVVVRSPFDGSTHLTKELVQVLEVLPRDELFQMPMEQLFDTAIAIVQIQERNRLRLFLRTDPFGRFCYCLVYVPRDIYSTETRLRIQQILVDRLGASGCEFSTYFSESVLTRVQFLLRLDPQNFVQVDPLQLEREVIQACRTWQDEYRSLLIERLGEAQGTAVLADFVQGFPAGYRERFDPLSAVVDMQHLLELGEGRPLSMSFYQPFAGGENRLHCKLYHLNSPLALSDMLPILENLGLRVLGEFPFQIQDKQRRQYWIHDFVLSYADGLEIDLMELNEPLQQAFLHIHQGLAENDSFNRLVLTAGLNWREVALLRAYGRYLKQIRMGFDLGYIASALLNHTDIARELVRLFKTRFYLARKLGDEDLADKQERLQQAILQALDSVAVLNEDRILRRYLALIQATLRTNFYQPDADGKLKNYFSFKFDPSLIPEMPRPVPRYEVFVYSPRVEGVHLRGGKVARGGLRWSDREEDYRTEVLGLVKAQQVKNAIIVPGGAKGGFVPRRLPNGTRDEVQTEAIACYRIFISGLLDLTDNLKDGEVVPPAGVLRYDEDDPYLVVAADKGTATFSDIANGIAADYGFWLGDAFASGGSAGYDHKKMGITARGAWVSVQRHFRERGIDVQRESISVIGIGDMAGDVFGNGLLRSDKVQLVAAFNHMHIFVDPDPDAERSFIERKRLFDLPRSTWADYDKALISEGGGVFSRLVKQIAISPQMKARFAIDADWLTPAELIQALLRAPVDLLWNGGIGTYIKSSAESHADVGDKANDGVRVNGCEVRAKVIGEGGNLGMTQLGRVEYALHGGACNTDFIDNAGGVNCSDNEVNIKILLNEAVMAGDMTGKQRNQLLAHMTDSVAERVLHDNYKQTQALSQAERRARTNVGEFGRLIGALESDGLLDRTLEFLPTDEELEARIAEGKSLTRPELAVLMSYSKMALKEALLQSDLPDDAALQRDLESAFPDALGAQFRGMLQQHRLKREIVSTQIANDLVNHMGPAFVQRLHEATGLAAATVVSAYVIAREVFHLPHWFRQIEALDYRVPADLQLQLMEELMRLGRRATRWFLSSRRKTLEVAHEVAHFGPRVATLGLRLDTLLQGSTRDMWQARYERYTEAGVPELLARMVAGTHHLYTLLPIVDASDETGRLPSEVATAWFAVGGVLELPWYAHQLTALPVESRWQALARENLRDDLDFQQRAIAVSVLQEGGDEAIDLRVQHWLEDRHDQAERWFGMLGELRSASSADYAMYAVAARELQNLAAEKSGR